MKSYLPATLAGIALTAAAFGFGAASAHASGYTNETPATAAGITYIDASYLSNND